jgi:hypothetical protein
VSNPLEFEPHTVDLRTLTPAQWTLLREHVVRRAHRQRSELQRLLLACAWGWICRRVRAAQDWIACKSADTGSYQQDPARVG